MIQSQLHNGDSVMSQILPYLNLNLVGLLALADLTLVARSTALAGNASWLDALILCPGFHRQQQADELNKGEYPATAAMTTGYVFRVENQATVYFLQQIGRTGCLTTLSTQSIEASGSSPGDFGSLVRASIASLTVAFLSFMLRSGEWWDVGIFGMFITARLLNVVVIRHRASSAAWKGQLEPGVRGDLLVLLSQDRWVRIQGLVDDLKAVTSGQWLRDATSMESAATSVATLLVYLAAALTINASQLGKVALLFVFSVSAGMLAASNVFVNELQINGCKVQRSGELQAYKRRLDLANQLVNESGRSDWAIRLGMIVPEQSRATGDVSRIGQEEVTM